MSSPFFPINQFLFFQSFLLSGRQLLSSRCPRRRCADADVGRRKSEKGTKVETSAWLFSPLTFRLQLIHSMPFLLGFRTFELLHCRGSTVESERFVDYNRPGKNDKGLKLYYPRERWQLEMVGILLHPSQTVAVITGPWSTHIIVTPQAARALSRKQFILCLFHHKHPLEKPLVLPLLGCQNLMPLLHQKIDIVQVLVVVLI
ncbi:unnamed protein product [Fraxinus pennsylvanica]|uniref:Uncharacterized protein n=1 Tax=Fraxinus pennsylvanica TaxID=56036 RepID=A0AAD2DS27_9LAMI|nr:unnamed protein product [Fraxinus pennsylvanica]